jgi:RND family efflux transporter MFP subunit
VPTGRSPREPPRPTRARPRAGRDLALLNLGYTEVRAPFDGRIDRRLVDPGNLVGSSEATVLASMNCIDPIYAYFTVSDSDVVRLIAEAGWNPAKTGATKRWPVFMATLGEKGYPHRGVLDFAAISLASTSGTLQMRGIFPNPDGRIMAGSYVRVRVPLATAKALLVPQEALASDQIGPFLLVVNQRHVVERRSVTLGPLVGQMRAITNGVGPNDLVVIEGTQKAVPGRAVTPHLQGTAYP